MTRLTNAAREWRIVAAFCALSALTPHASAQQDGSQPKVIPVSPGSPARPTMTPIADDEAPAKAKLIKVKPAKPKPPPKPADPEPQPQPDVPAAPSGDPMPEIRPMPQIMPRSRRPAAAPAPAAQDPPAPEAAAPAQPETPSGDAVYEYCNRTSFTIMVAIGIRDEAQLRTRGWWTLYPGQCKDVIKGKLKPTYFTFAKTHFAHSGPMRIWGGSHMLCVGRGQFQANSDGTGVCPPGHEAQGFAHIDMQGRPSWRTSVTESESLSSLPKARIAGLQRLLTDLSLYAGEADGVESAGFKQAVDGAKIKFGYPPQEDFEQVYLRLLRQAALEQSNNGLTFCNRSESVLWVAIGLDNEGQKQSRGWWRIQAGQCEKVIKDKLSQRYVFAHASNDRGGTEGIWTGKYAFCTKDSKFEMDGADGCETRGAERSGFFAIDTQGRSGAVYSFTPRRNSRAQAQ